MENTMAYMTELNKIEFRKENIEKPVKNQVMVKLEYVGICGSDVHYFHDGRCGDFIVDGDFVLGHECAGEVVDIGEDVKYLKVGDKVALEPGITCGECEFCKSGKYNLCADVQFLATPPVAGCYCNYINFPENMCFKLPYNMTTKEGALVEPLSVGLHAATQGNVTLGDKVIILGAGCIGLCTLLACKAQGATDITIVDVFDNRLDVAKKIGATTVINGKNVDVLSEDFLNRFDKVFETAGSNITLEQSAYLVKKAGTIVLIGMSSAKNNNFDFAQLMAKEAKVETVFRYRNIYPKAIKAMESKLIDVNTIVSHEFNFEDLEEGFNQCIVNKENVIKTIIKM